MRAEPAALVVLDDLFDEPVGVFACGDDVGGDGRAARLDGSEGSCCVCCVLYVCYVPGSEGCLRR